MNIAIIYVSTTGSPLQIIYIYMYIYIYIYSAGKVANILYNLILISTTFQWKITNNKGCQHLCYQMVYISPVNWIRNSQYSMLVSYKETQFYKKETPRNISNIYVRIFGKYLRFWYFMYIWMIQPIVHDNFYNILFNNNTIKIVNIYLNTTWYLLQIIYIFRCRKKSNIVCWLILISTIFQLKILNKKDCQHLCWEMVYKSLINWIEKMQE